MNYNTLTFFYFQRWKHFNEKLSHKTADCSMYRIGMVAVDLIFWISIFCSHFSKWNEIVVQAYAAILYLIFKTKKISFYTWASYENMWKVY